MVRQPGFVDADERLRVSSATGNDLERIAAPVDAAMIRADLAQVAPGAGGAEGAPLGLDPVLIVTILPLRAKHGRATGCTPPRLVGQRVAA